MFDFHLRDMADALADAKLIPAESRQSVVDVLRTYWADQIAICWSVEDVRGERPHLSVEQAVEVLYEILNHHDPQAGVTYATISAVADRLYPAAAPTPTASH